MMFILPPENGEMNQLTGTACLRATCVDIGRVCCDATPFGRGIQAPVAVLLSTLQLFKYAYGGEKGPGGRSLVTDQSTP